MALWERIDGETEASWDAFRKYCRAILKGRSVRRMAGTCKVRSATIHEWIHKYNWKERANAWDSYLQTKHIKDLAARQSKRDLKRYEDRFGDEEWASKQLPKINNALLDIALDDDPKAKPAARSAIGDIRAMAHHHELDLSGLTIEQDASEALAHTISKGMAKLTDEEAAMLRKLIAKMGE